MPKIPELPPILTGNASQDINRLREYLIRFVQEYSTEDAGYASSNEEQGNSSSDSVQPTEEITVDAELSLESTNPIQNRAVAEALANLPAGGTNLLAQQVSLSGIIVNANANVSGNINITLQGYTPIAAGQIRFSNTALSINSFYIVRNNNTDTLLFSARNNISSAVTNATATFTVLYMEDTE